MVSAVPFSGVCEEHKPVQHRDGKVRWCNTCGLTADFQVPEPGFTSSKTKTDGTAVDLQLQAKIKVVNVFNRDVGSSKYFAEGKFLTPDDCYVVWFSKVLANWKALVSTTIPDGVYYEVTYNGAVGETYVDVYTKNSNHVIPD